MLLPGALLPSPQHALELDWTQTHSLFVSKTPRPERAECLLQTLQPKLDEMQRDTSLFILVPLLLQQGNQDPEGWLTQCHRGNCWQSQAWVQGLLTSIEGPLPSTIFMPFRILPSHIEQDRGSGSQRESSFYQQNHWAYRAHHFWQRGWLSRLSQQAAQQVCQPWPPHFLWLPLHWTGHSELQCLSQESYCFSGHKWVHSLPSAQPHFQGTLYVEPSTLLLRQLLLTEVMGLPLSDSTVHWMGPFPRAHEACICELSCHQRGWTSIDQGFGGLQVSLLGSILAPLLQNPEGLLLETWAIDAGVLDLIPNDHHILATNVVRLWESQEAWILGPVLGDPAQATASLWALLLSIIKWRSGTQWSWRTASVLLWRNGQNTSAAVGLSLPPAPTAPAWLEFCYLHRSLQRNSLGFCWFSLLSFSVLCFLSLYYFLLLLALVLLCSSFNSSLQWKVQLLNWYHSPLI